VSRVLQFLASVVLTFGLFAQAWHLYRKKTVTGITPILVVSLAITQLIRLNYGVAIQEWPLILAGILNVVPIVLIAIGYYRFRAEPGETG
jgi:uncharacterized protein with PQ loop repeat